MHLFSNRSQKTLKCGKNASDTLGYASCATFLFLPHFDVFCDLLLNRHQQHGIYLLNGDLADLYLVLVHPNRFDYLWEVAAVIWVLSIAELDETSALLIPYCLFRYLGICITDLLFTYRHTVQWDPAIISGLHQNYLL